MESKLLIELLIFDLDGTLFKTETVDIFAFNEALAINGYPHKSDDEIMSFVGFPLDGVCRTMLNTDDPVLLAKFRQDVIKFESFAIPRHGEFYTGAIDMLKRLKERGYKLCICSNGNKEYVNDIAEVFGLWDVFDEIWYENSGISKSDAIKILLDKSKADEFIMIGDRLVDIEASSANGGISIGVTYGFGKEEVFRADYVVDSIDALESLLYKLTLKS